MKKRSIKDWEKLSESTLPNKTIRAIKVINADIEKELKKHQNDSNYDGDDDKDFVMFSALQSLTGYNWEQDDAALHYFAKATQPEIYLYYLEVIIPALLEIYGDDSADKRDLENAMLISGFMNYQEGIKIPNYKEDIELLKPVARKIYKNKFFGVLSIIEMVEECMDKEDCLQGYNWIIDFIKEYNETAGGTISPRAKHGVVDFFPDSERQIGFHTPAETERNLSILNNLCKKDFCDSSWKNDLTDSAAQAGGDCESGYNGISVYFPNSKNDNPKEEEFNTFRIQRFHLGELIYEATEKTVEGAAELINFITSDNKERMINERLGCILPGTMHASDLVKSLNIGETDLFGNSETFMLAIVSDDKLSQAQINNIIFELGLPEEHDSIFDEIGEWIFAQGLPAKDLDELIAGGSMTAKQREEADGFIKRWQNVI